MTFRDTAMTCYTDPLFLLRLFSSAEYYLTIYSLDADYNFDNLQFVIIYDYNHLPSSYVLRPVPSVTMSRR